MQFNHFSENANKKVFQYDRFIISVSRMRQLFALANYSPIELNRLLMEENDKQYNKRMKRKNTMDDVKRRFIRSQFINGINVVRIGGVHRESGVFLGLQELKNLARWEETKKPFTEERHVGLEIELISPLKKPTIILIASELGLKNYMALKSDGSIRSDYGMHGHELCFVVPMSELEKTLAKIQVLLNRINAKVNDSCGLHVHLDMRKTNKEQREETFLNLKKGLNVIKNVVSPRRLKNRFCRFRMADSFDNQSLMGRYYAVNTRAFSKYETIEIRAFHGTVNTDEIYQYVMALDKIAFTKNDRKRATKSEKILSKIYGQSVVDFMKSQKQKFVA
jgi:hypothetical protein